MKELVLYFQGNTIVYDFEPGAEEQMLALMNKVMTTRADGNRLVKFTLNKNFVLNVEFFIGYCIRDKRRELHREAQEIMVALGRERLKEIQRDNQDNSWRSDNMESD